jgi:hypothetical protein
MIVLSMTAPGAQPGVPLRAGMVITSSLTIRPGTYRIPSRDLDRPALTVRGSNLTIDFNGAELVGSDIDADPDSFAGLGILVDGGSHITIRNARVRGFKVGLLARDASRFHLTRSDFSHNWKQRLYSLVEHESLLDWMSYHQNDKNEWLRYGAAVYLDGCRDCEIDHVTAVQGQNGLMMTRTEGAKVWNNTFSFLSAIGIGMYRSSRNTVVHNKVDWCVRGYSHGFYNRGQDSAGILMYEQSSRNTVAHNSVTHGGDGLFLWAGQSTMDTGDGGCNDNVFFGNDFSHAPANGIEATFSRNRFYRNRVEENWHGVWGGYSYESEFIENDFRDNDEGIAIEHGQHNTIVGNRFEGRGIALRLWANEKQDPGWQYPKRRDTRSRDYYIAGNTFSRVQTALQVERTDGIVFDRNTLKDVTTAVELGEGNKSIAIDVPSGMVHLRGDDRIHIDKLPAGMDPMIEEGERRGREFIIVDEWGPYDWKSPKLWPDGLLHGASPLRLRVLGPEGQWKLATVRGASIAPESGQVGDVLTVTPRPPGGRIDFDIQLEYRGGEVVDPRGRRTPAGQPYSFGFTRYFVPVSWHVRLFEFDEATDPVSQPAAFSKLLAGTPRTVEFTDRLDYMSGRSILAGDDSFPRDRVALSATAEADLDRRHELLVISDDGVRIWDNDRLIVDRWNDHESMLDRVALEAGRHRLRVEYYDRTGFAELRVQLER